MILIRNIRMKIGYNQGDLQKKVKAILHSNDIKRIKILKESLDSRKHKDIHYRLTVGVYTDSQDNIIKKVNDKNIMLTNESKYCFPHILNSDLSDFLNDAPEYRPIIIGSGPAGYHAAVKLCLAGFKPIVIERGFSVEDRIKDVEDFWEKGILDPDSNVCFGEGGAGTFSDGKLNTGNKDKGGYFKEVLDTFIKFGADECISYKSKPHIGTDELRKILINMRHYIEQCGGEVRFGTTLKSIKIEDEINSDVYLSKLPTYNLFFEINPKYSKESIRFYNIKTHSVILAIGHSARDTYKMLFDNSFILEPKAFAMGVRVEHDTELINQAMYGADYKTIYGDKLPNADYKLVYHTKDGSRNVFSFCMCPGGYVVNSSSEDGTVVINGMSYSGRDGNNSNSAIVISINPDDFEERDVFGGLNFQLNLERKAYEAGHGSIPVQLYGDIKTNIKSNSLGTIQPEIKGKWTFADLRQILPEFMMDAFIEAMESFGEKIEGFNMDDTVVSAIESRTSSPLRILRDKKTMMAPNYLGILPTGEGAGYAGGITSAAADGIKAAESVSEYLIEDLIECYKAFESSKYIK